MQATRVRTLVTDPASGQAVVRRRIPDELRQRRLRGTGRDYVTDQGYRIVTRRGHPLADKSGRVYEHRQVLYDLIGDGPHACHWCGRKVAWRRQQGCTRLVVDHLNDDRLDNQPENLTPSCVRCNSERARRPDFLTHCEGGHPWTPETTYRRPGGGRWCRTCQRARDRKRLERKKAQAA